jgi:hypothetical protein
MKYTASLYWALTTLMKSPWFHPTSPGEFAIAIALIICGSVFFAYFIGNVTAVITAANAAGGRYRGQIAQLKVFCTTHGIDADTTSKLLAYQDALWTETYGGVDRTAMLRTLPPHLLPRVVIQMYKPLLDACPFLYDCTAFGCATFLQALQVRVCDRGDKLLTAGSMSHTFYILQRGEIKINFEPDAPLQTAEHYVPGGRIGGSKVKSDRRGSAKDAMRGRTDKMGTLLGFQDAFAPPKALDFSVNALGRAVFLSISRVELKNLLTTYADDQEHFARAILKANETIRGGNRRSSIRASAEGIDLAALGGGGGGTPPLGGTPRSPDAGVPAGGHGLPSMPGMMLSSSSPARPPPIPAGETEVGALRAEVAAIRADLEPMRQLLQAQSRLLEQLLGESKMSA